MVRGKRQAMVSAMIKANASIACPGLDPGGQPAGKEVLADGETWAGELNEGSEFKVNADKKKAVEQHHTCKKGRMVMTGKLSCIRSPAAQ